MQLWEPQGRADGSSLTDRALPAPNLALERDSSLKGFPAALSLKYTLLSLLFTKNEKKAKCPEPVLRKLLGPQR